MADLNNVIDFPGKKREDTIGAPVVRKTSQRRQRMTLLSLLSVFVMATAMNSMSFTAVNSTASQNERSIASVGELRDYKVERKLAGRLGTAVRRELASIGYRPSAEDKLRFEQLEGKYLVRFNKGKVREINFMKDASNDLRPKYVNNRVEFVESNKHLFKDYTSLVTKKSHESEGKIFETYSLMDQDQQSVATVKFQLDRAGRMISMNVE